jgi:hypothetical protein
LLLGYQPWSPIALTKNSLVCPLGGCFPVFPPLWGRGLPHPLRCFPCCLPPRQSWTLPASPLCLQSLQPVINYIFLLPITTFWRNQVSEYSATTLALFSFFNLLRMTIAKVLFNSLIFTRKFEVKHCVTVMGNTWLHFIRNHNKNTHIS